MESLETIKIPSFDDALKTVGERISQEEFACLTDLLDASSVGYGQFYRRQKFRELKEAECSCEHLMQLKEQAEGSLLIAKECLAVLPKGGWVVGLVFVAGFIACFGSEIVFNRAILPWILGVPPQSILGMALALAPATAPVLLDRILVQLLGICDPLEAITKACGLTDRLRSLSRVLFLTLAGAVTLYSVWVLADARAVASAIMNDESATVMTATQQHVVNLSLLLVSLALTVNGALFYIFGVHELRNSRAATKMRDQVSKREQELGEINSRLSAALPALAVARGAWDSVDMAETSIVAAFVADAKYKLAQAVARPATVQPASIRVKEILQSRLAPGAAA